MNTLSSQLPGEGQYMLPRFSPQATPEEQQKQTEALEGKPWAIITYHGAYELNMVKPVIRGFIISFICVLLVCLVIRRFDTAYKNFLSIFTSVLTFGVICFLFVWYNQHNWFQTSWEVLWGELIDNLAGWGLCGVWLGWWYKRNTHKTA